MPPRLTRSAPCASSSRRSYRRSQTRSSSSLQTSRSVNVSKILAHDFIHSIFFCTVILEWDFKRKGEIVKQSGLSKDAS